MTVKELKSLIADWPEVAADGEPTEVWLETGTNLSSECHYITPLNCRTADCDGRTTSDLLLSPHESVWEEKP